MGACMHACVCACVCMCVCVCACVCQSCDGDCLHFCMGQRHGQSLSRPQMTACLSSEMLVGHCWSDSEAQSETDMRSTGGSLV